MEHKKDVRVFMDGAFDVMHFGHMNAFRLGRSLGTHLIVGVNSDESITECKGPPLMKDHERLTMVQSCKFVDEVVPGCPYIMNHQYLEYIFDKYKVDYVVHGDDPCIVDGKDVYGTAKATGRYRSIPRTEGISTTDLVGRILSLGRVGEHPVEKDQNGSSNSCKTKFMGQRSKFLTTGNMLAAFGAGKRPLTPGMKVVYIDGAWDMFNCGHVALLKAAKLRGDYLIVGIFGDIAWNGVVGNSLPLMNLQERVLAVLGCRFVDDVVMDAPYEVTQDMVQQLNISEVVCGNVSYDPGSRASTPRDSRFHQIRDLDNLTVTVVENPSTFDPATVINRIHDNHQAFQAKFERKMKAENEFWQGKYCDTTDIDKS